MELNFNRRTPGGTHMIRIEDQKLHLLGKILEQADGSWMLENGFTLSEIEAADALYQEIDDILLETYGLDWINAEAL